MEAHNKLQEGSQWEEVYVASMDLREDVAEDPRDMITAGHSVRVTEMEGMAASNLGSDAQEVASNDPWARSKRQAGESGFEQNCITFSCANP